MCLPYQILLQCGVGVHFIAENGAYTNLMQGKDAYFIVRCSLITFHVDYRAKMPAVLSHIPQRQWNQDAAFRHAR